MELKELKMALSLVDQLLCFGDWDQEGNLHLGGVYYKKREMQDLQISLQEDVFEMESNSETEEPSTEVKHWDYDWKEGPSREDAVEMSGHVLLTQGRCEQFNPPSADTKIYIVGPPSFFAWLEKEGSKYGDTMEILVDAEQKWEEDEEVEEVEKYYMKEEELWVKTDKERDLRYEDWHKELYNETE